jgi:hypothetical protein
VKVIITIKVSIMAVKLKKTDAKCYDIFQAKTSIVNE